MELQKTPRVRGFNKSVGRNWRSGGVVALLFACIELTRTANLVRAGMEFIPVRDPADGARQGEDHGEHVGRNADRFQNDS